MTSTALTSFYFVLAALMAVYALYSWFQQARIELRAIYRSSSIIWSVILIWLGFIWDFIASGDPGLPLFLAIFLVISILDGFSGLGPKKVVLSGYFRRTLDYQNLAKVTLISAPIPNRPFVMAALYAKNQRVYYLRMRHSVEEIESAFRKRAPNLEIDVQRMGG